mmetsp:Transcript_59451/g.158193  ORF Transcript_59451/g.158193 Transcript_59451/m.158193 type:complete len:276 (-) Transcript_59451:62-889(-)
MQRCCTRPAALAHEGVQLHLEAGSGRPRSCRRMQSANLGSTLGSAESIAEAKRRRLKAAEAVTSERIIAQSPREQHCSLPVRLSLCRESSLKRQSPLRVQHPGLSSTISDLTHKAQRFLESLFCQLDLGCNYTAVGIRRLQHRCHGGVVENRPLVLFGALAPPNPTGLFKYLCCGQGFARSCQQDTLVDQHFSPSPHALSIIRVDSGFWRQSLDRLLHLLTGTGPVPRRRTCHGPVGQALRLADVVAGLLSRRGGLGVVLRPFEGSIVHDLDRAK